MRYLLLIYGDEKQRKNATPAQTNEVMAAYDKYTRELMEAKAMLAGEALQDTSSATAVRVRNGKTLTTDGPFAETKEQLGGFYMVEAKDLNEAIRWAAKVPASKNGTIEVRPIFEIPHH